MTNMEDVFGDEWQAVFATREHDGLITLRNHPEFPSLRIANYTPQCAYAGMWDNITTASRGLIFDVNSGKILARPFAKFFNYGQKEAPNIDLDAELYGVGNKFDGSLGIGYIRPDGQFAIATRGSFNSEQARHANALIADSVYNWTADRWLWYRADASIGLTPLFEIIYPENRIVLNYEKQDYLQPIGWVVQDTGEYLRPGASAAFEFGGKIGESLTFRDVLERKPRRNAEGYVVWIDKYTAVKIKQEDYVALHAVVTNLSEKKVWEVIREEDQPKWDAFVAALPDELQQWAERVAADLLHAVRDTERFLLRWYDQVQADAWDEAGQPDDATPRAIFARVAKEQIHPKWIGFIFSILDGKNYMPKIWDLYKPTGLGLRPGVNPEDGEGEAL